MFKKFFFKNWPVLLIFLLAFIFFWKFFIRGFLPIPADITVGMYFPWLDYKWGYEVGVPVKNSLISDIVSQVYPWRLTAIEILKQGQFPLWNSYSFLGYPLLANITTAAFYPLNIFYFLFSATTAWSLIVFLQVLLSLLFMYFYLSSLKISSVPSIIGALSFAFCGFMMTKLEWATGGQAGMWLPLFLILVDQIIKKPSFLKIILASLVLATINLGGHFQVPVYVLGFSFVYAVFRIINLEEKKHLKIKILSLLAVLIFGFTLVAFQLLPTLELYKLSIREGEGYIKGYNFGLLPFKHLVVFLAPDFFGHPSTLNYSGFWNYHEMTGYFGLIPLIFALSAIFLKKDKQTIFFSILTLTILSFILPTPWAKIPYLFSFPAIGTSSATRLFFLLGFLASTMAAFGSDALFKNWSKAKSKFLKQMILIFLVLLGITVIALSHKMMVSLRNLILPWGLFLAFFFMFLMTFLKDKRKPLLLFFWFSVIFLTVFDLFRFGWKYNPFIKKEMLFPTTPIIEYLQKQEKPFRVLAEKGIMPSNMWISYKLDFPVGYDPIYPQRTATFLTVASGGKFENPAGRYGEIKQFDSPLVDLMNVKYLLVSKDKQEKNNNLEEKILLPKFRLVFEDRSVQVFENTTALPRAFIVYNYEIQKDGAKIFESLLRSDFDLSKQITLEEILPFSLKEGVINEVSYSSKTNGDSEVLVDQSGDGLLFVSDSYYPGWQAFVDGEETKIYRADYNFRAVVVPAGEHKVIFKYKPKSFKIGVYLSSGALILILVGRIFFWKRNKI